MGPIPKPLENTNRSLTKTSSYRAQNNPMKKNNRMMTKLIFLIMVIREMNNKCSTFVYLPLFLITRAVDRSENEGDD